MKIPYYEAIDKDTGNKYTGFYFEYPSTTYCFTDDYKRNPPQLIPCLVTHRMGDWGLPNTPQLVSPIDKSTMKLLGWIETDKDTYDPDDYISDAIPMTFM